MKKFELTIAPNYVSDWGIVEAVRELFQNALDQETICNDNKMFFNYDAESCELHIGNKSSKLEIKSLLFGGSTKADNKDTIGKFGEGYKLATLVLTRLDKPITFYNYAKKEIWKPRFCNSRRFDSKILTFFVDKHVWAKVPHNHLEITVENVTPEDYVLIENSNLNLQTVEDFTAVDEGRILWDYPGDVFVNGLLVEHRNDMDCGYDLKPEHIKLDRDRKAIKDFDLRYLTAKMHIQASKEKPEKVEALINAGKKDVEYVHYRIEGNPKIVDNMKKAFIKEHGDTAVPVQYQHQADEVMEKYENAIPIIVNENQQKLLDGVNKANLNEAEDKLSVQELLNNWFDALCLAYDIDDKSIDEFEELLRQVNE